MGNIDFVEAIIFRTDAFFLELMQNKSRWQSGDGGGLVSGRFAGAEAGGAGSKAVIM